MMTQLPDRDDEGAVVLAGDLGGTLETGRALEFLQTHAED